MTCLSSSLCFCKALQKFRDEKISEKEYHCNILAHCMGYLHDEDDDEPLPSLLSLRWDNIFAFAVECFIERKDFVGGTKLQPFSSSISLQNV